MRRPTTLLLAALLSGACQVEYHPYDTRLDGEREINTMQIARIERACASKPTLRFAVIGDTQRWYDETLRAVDALNRRDDIDFVIHLGDMTDFGLRAEFERQRDLLLRLEVPFVVLPGNHDCLATGRELFSRIFGPSDFAFTAAGVRFVCLNTNSLEFGHDRTVPDFGFIGEQLARFPAEAARTVVAMHAKPYTEQFDNGAAPRFQEQLRRFPGLLCCLNGHGHNFCVDEVFGDGVIYYECDCIAKRRLLLFTIDENGYTYEQVAF